jgi:protease-4
VFLDRVATGRDQTREQVHEVAQGRVWIGSDAHGHGLVDELGGYQIAVQAAAELAQLPPGHGIRRVEPKLSWAQQLALQLRISGARLSGALLGPAVREVQQQLGPLDLMRVQFDRLQAVLSGGQPLTHCLCTAE